MKKMLWIAVVAVASASIAVTTLRAEQFGHGGTFWLKEGIVKKLELTPDQVSRIEEIHYTFAKADIDVQAKIRSAQLTFAYLIKKETLDEKQIDDLITQIGAARQAQTMNALKRMVEIRKVLTPEQWEKCQPLMARFGADSGMPGRETMGCEMKARGMMGKEMTGRREKDEGNDDEEGSGHHGEGGHGHQDWEED